MRRYFLAFLLILSLSLLTVGSAIADEVEPGDEPGRSSDSARSESSPGSQSSPVDRLAAPPMPANPEQADHGAQVYYQVCMACHGDRGQGLTEEWREAWEDDSYCWDSKCHGPNHPPWGFSFPQEVMGVIGPDTLARFETAQDLYTYLIDTMPWWNPGYLKPEEYWQVTAFLIREHKGLPAGVQLDAGNASVFRLRPTAPLPEDARPQALLVALMLASTAGLLAIQHHLRR